MAEFYEGEPWSEMALRDLRGEVLSGSTPEVKRKAQELGLTWRGQES